MMTPHDEASPRLSMRSDSERANATSRPAKPPVVDSAMRRGAVATVQLLGGLSLITPLLALVVKVFLIWVGVGATPTLEIGWAISLGAATLALIGCGALFLSSPDALPVGDLRSSDEKWTP